MKSKTLLILLVVSTYFQAQSISGKVIDGETMEPVSSANIVVSPSKEIFQTDETGKFVISSKEVVHSLKISHVGYTSKEIEISAASQNGLVIKLERQIIPAQTVLVTASVNRRGESPAAFSEISEKQIQQTHTTQDVPEFLSAIPSTTYYSEGGNGIGYNYLSIRGFDQRRISISINGIPQNDPEDNNVYWVDFSDILSTTGFIQVQRGSGGIFGYPAIGGSINIITKNRTPEKSIHASTLMGTYNTKKYLIDATSGLMDGKYSFSAKFSQTRSDGYRDRSWVDLKSYYVSASMILENFSTQINMYGGPIKDGLVYNGLAKFAVKDLSQRKQNLSYWEADSKQYTYTSERRKDEIENFSQPHYEILNEYVISKNVTLNSALFLVLGNGFFNFDGSWADTTYLRLTQKDGFANGETPVNALLRGMVENKQFGWIPRIQINHNHGVLTAGIEYRNHRSLHYGTIQSADNLVNTGILHYRYYQFNGAKNILNGFFNEQYKFDERISLLAELQLAHNEYRLYNEKFLGTDFSITHTFFNPRLGINYKLDTEKSFYATFARVSREPRLNDYYNAVESSGGAVPLFEMNSDGSYNFKQPLVLPETMNSFDVGVSWNNSLYQMNLNYFYMSFENELIKNGRLDIFGAPMMGNAKRTVHSGVEFASLIQVNENLQCIFNATYSNNTIKEAVTFGSYSGSSLATLHLSGNKIGGFPDFLANLSVRYKLREFTAQIDAKYVGNFYSDNYGKSFEGYKTQYPGLVDYADNTNDAYFNVNFFASYQMELFQNSQKSKIYFQVNNVFNSLFSMYAIGKEFFPAAERNFVAGVELGI